MKKSEEGQISQPTHPPTHPPNTKKAHSKFQGYCVLFLKHQSGQQF